MDIGRIAFGTHLAERVELLESKLGALRHYTLPDGSQIDLTDSATVMELIAERARLDFLFERPCRMPVEGVGRWVVQEWAGRTTGRGVTPRAAIDDARKNPERGLAPRGH